MKARKTSVLVVDDDTSITTIIESYLYVKNIDIVAVNSVFDAIELLKKQEFDLILSDVYMPNINGFEFLLWLKKNNIQSHIVIMTAQANEKAKEIYHNYGILKYLSKPLELQKLLELINQIDKTGFSSTIKEITLFDYIQIMSLSRKTDVLCIESPLIDFKTYLYFKDGEIVEAEFGQEKGEDAFLKIIKINGGVISEVSKEIPEVTTIKTPSMSLLFKATQIIDEENFKNKKTNTKKYNILILNDNNLDIPNITDNLLKNDDIDVKVVNSGKEMALAIQEKFFDMIMFDINIIKNNGPEFLIWMKKNNINSKILILINDEIEVNNIRSANETVIYLQKPIDFEYLNNIISTEIKSGFSGKINKITLFDYIQMVSLSRKTKTISISSPLTYTEGIIHFHNGNVIHSTYENLIGVDALFKIMTISGGVITELKVQENVEPTIKLSLPSLLMKATAYIEQENLRKTNINIDQKIIDSINEKIKNLSEPVVKNNDLNQISNTVVQKQDTFINKSSLLQKPQEQDNIFKEASNHTSIGEKATPFNQFSLLNLKRKVTGKLNMPEEENIYLKQFESLRFIIPEISEKGEKAIRNPSTDMSVYQLLRKIDGTLNIDIIYQTYYHHLDLFTFFNKFETVLSFIHFKEVDKSNIKTTIFQILLYAKSITPDVLKKAIETYLGDSKHTNQDRDFLDGSFLIELGSITNSELVKVTGFVNKFNRFIDTL